MGEYVFRLPDIGEGIAEAEIAAWHVQVGSSVGEDEPLVDMLTDKANVELTSPVAGRVVGVAGAVGDLVATGSPLVVLDVEADVPDETSPEASETDGRFGQPAAEPAPIAAADEQGQVPATAAGAPKPNPPSGEVPGPRGDPGPAAAPAPNPPAERPKVHAAPAVRRRAQELGIDLSDVHPSSPNGRVRHSDLDAYLAYSLRREAGSPDARPAAVAAERREGVEAVRVLGLRRRIAERMTESKRRIPHFSYVEEVDVTELEQLRHDLNAEHGASRGRLTLLPFVVRALVAVLPRFPQVNARFDDEAGVVDRHEGVHVGIATQTPGGLVVPVVAHAEAHDLWSVGAEVSRLASAAREGRASARELGGSTITVTSLGALGGVATTPVINHPEVAIVGVNKMVERVVVRAGQPVVRRMMNLSCSFDHRVVDGYDAAEFVQALRRALEQPARLFL